ncbi:hypothetical protein MMC26_003011 [Xylographa opegraphella]|nr:hypothetical protein [Xylographa opegraphella]
MVKDDQTVIEEFSELVNMEPGELEAWLKEEDSAGAGWKKVDVTGETVGHERYALAQSEERSIRLSSYSGRMIVDILKRNPSKDPEKYDEADIPHMRKVVAYCKRHLAQEGKAKQDPDSKSAKSLKNWGHNPQKA